MTLHEIEDLARYEPDHTPRYRALMRLYTRKLNREWRTPLRGSEVVQGVLRDLMLWIYRQLEAEYEYQTSDEQIAETIRINEYLFTEDGRRSAVLN